MTNNFHPFYPERRNTQIKTANITSSDQLVALIKEYGDDNVVAIVKNDIFKDLEEKVVDAFPNINPILIKNKARRIRNINIDTNKITVKEGEYDIDNFIKNCSFEYRVKSLESQK